MREIALANGKGVALVDDEDFEILSQYKWFAKPSSHTTYAKTCLYHPKRFLYLHRMLLPNAPQVDHIDGNGLNNQRSNLRSATHQQNMWNQPPKGGRRFRGISQRGNQWIAYIGYPQQHLGMFPSAEAAAAAYDRAAILRYGEFARLNRPYDIVPLDLDTAA